MNTKWNQKDVTKWFKSCISKREILSKMGLVPCGGNYKTLTEYLLKYDLNEKELLGQAHLRGKSRNSKHKKSLDKILIKESYYSSVALKNRLIQELNWESVCSVCGLDTWNGKRIPIELDHQNGDNRDNRLENLRLICPNCHAQTKNYKGRNTQSYKNRKKYECSQCHKEISKWSRTGLCGPCYNFSIRKVKRPSLEILERLVAEHGLKGTGSIYNVADNTIRKWIKNYKKDKIL